MKRLSRAKVTAIVIIILLSGQIGVSASYSVFGAYFLDPNGARDEAIIPYFADNSQMTEFIRKTHYEPYSLLTNNCIHKSLRIKRKAEDLGLDVDLIGCWTAVPMTKLLGWLSIQPHLYTIVEGKRVDVALDPLRRGQMYDVSKVIRIGHINICKLLGK